MEKYDVMNVMKEQRDDENYDQLKTDDHLLR